MKKINNLETALQVFESSAIQHAKATETGDYKLANKSYEIIKNAVAFLKKENGIILLSDFLTSDSVGVRLWAATYLLPILEKDSIKTLKCISNSMGIHALTAKMTISEWEKGNLHL